MTPSTTRRSQQERRETTIAKLVDATIDALLEFGYKGTTVKEISARAGVSHGGLFRHFSSVLDLVIAAGEEIARRQIAAFETKLAAVDETQQPIAAAIGLIRDACRSPINTVFYELLIAARTDAQLRQALAPSTAKYFEAIIGAAKQVPGVERIPADSLEALVFAAVHLFDGETLARIVYPRPDAEEKRLAFAVAAIQAMAS